MQKVVLPHGKMEPAFKLMSLVLCGYEKDSLAIESSNSFWHYYFILPSADISFQLQYLS